MAAVLIAVALPCHPALSAEGGPLWPLAEAICKMGKRTPPVHSRHRQALGLPEYGAIRYFRDAGHRGTLFASDSQCRGDKPVEHAPFLIVISHALEGALPSRATGTMNSYVTSADGELIRAIYTVGYPSADGGTDRDTDEVVALSPTIRGLFEHERDFWLVRYGKPTH